jgi:hypothetical protein
MDDNIINQKKLTAAMNVTRKCSGTTLLQTEPESQ